jgi:hypothetical protein
VVAGGGGGEVAWRGQVLLHVLCTSSKMMAAISADTGVCRQVRCGAAA